MATHSDIACLTKLKDGNKNVIKVSYCHSGSGTNYQYPKLLTYDTLEKVESLINKGNIWSLQEYDKLAETELTNYCNEGEMYYYDIKSFSNYIYNSFTDYKYLYIPNIIINDNKGIWLCSSGGDYETICNFLFHYNLLDSGGYI